MSAHTPGPWYTKREGFSTVYVEARIGGGWIQEVAACGPTANGSDEQEFNARLIAAAPDLLEVLQEILNDGVHCDVVPHLHRKAIAAIAKATGAAS